MILKAKAGVTKMVFEQSQARQSKSTPDIMDYKIHIAIIMSPLSVWMPLIVQCGDLFTFIKFEGSLSIIHLLMM